LTTALTASMKKTGVLAVMITLAAACFAQNLPRVVVLPLENRAGERHGQDTETLTELLSTFINETLRLNVIDRFELNATMAARQWRMEDWEDNAKTAEMGEAINAMYVVRGTVSPLGDNLLVSARILDIHTAELLGSTNTLLEHMNEAYLKMNSLAQLLTYMLVTPVQPEPSVQTVIAAEPIEPVQPPVEKPTRRERSPKHPREKTPLDPAAYRLNSLGVSAGTSFATPWLIFTVQGTLAPWRYTFFDIGCDLGLITQREAAYWCLYPFVRFAVFLPFRNSGGWYAGTGAGLMLARYTFPYDDFTIRLTTFTWDINTGFLFRDFLNISYTFRLGRNVNSSSVFDGIGLNHKISVGYTYRF